MLLPPKKQVASLDVDAQQCFTPLCPDELPVPEGHEIAAELNAQAQFASLRLGTKEAHSPKAHWVATDEHPQLSKIEGKHMDVRWKIHAVPGTKGFELISGLPHPAEYDFFIWKGVELDMHPYGGCFHDHANQVSTGIIEFLKHRQITTILVGGLALDYCVKVTALQLAEAGFKVIVNMAATRGLHIHTTKDAIALMEKKGVHFIDSISELTQSSY